MGTLPSDYERQRAGSHSESSRAIDVVIESISADGAPCSRQTPMLRTRSERVAPPTRTLSDSFSLDYVEGWSPHRFHSSLGYLSPCPVGSNHPPEHHYPGCIIDSTDLSVKVGELQRAHPMPYAPAAPSSSLR